MHGFFEFSNKYNLNLVLNWSLWNILTCSLHSLQSPLVETCLLKTIIQDPVWLMLLAESCLTLCGPKDCSWPRSSVHGLLQARILDRTWDRTWVACIAGGFFTIWATNEAPIWGLVSKKEKKIQIYYCHICNFYDRIQRQKLIENKLIQVLQHKFSSPKSTCCSYFQRIKR